MDIKKISPMLSVSPQISVADIGVLAARGFQSVVNNRPDGESEDQPASGEIEAACARHGLTYLHMPVVSGQVRDEDVGIFETAMRDLSGPVLAFCRTGTRSTSLWALSEARHLTADAILDTAKEAGYDLAALRNRLEARRREVGTEGRAENVNAVPFDSLSHHDVVIVGGGAGGLAAAASLLKRRPGLDIAIVEPKEMHYYQPGWTMVGGGVFDRDITERSMKGLIPKGVHWVRAAVSGFEPEQSRIVLEDGERIAYKVLIAAPGIKLDWGKVEGLRETLGRNGVTSNYLFDMAPYTWELVQSLRQGRALFTQPPMPIKCAGAPQKAMYLSCDYWLKAGRLKNLDVEFMNAGGVLFGVSDYVPALMDYVNKYGAKLNFNQKLVAVDGPARTAWFDVTDAEGNTVRREEKFDMLHAVPPQTAPDFVAESSLASEAGWLEVSDETLQHPRYGNVFGLGDAISAPNAKTAAAVRKQAPIAAVNALAVLDGKTPRAIYDGYGSCPLTVERGKVVLAEFGYGGVLKPTLPQWVLQGKKPTRLGWTLKEKMMPWIYFDLMLKAREWYAAPHILAHDPAVHAAQDACVVPEPGTKTGTR